MKVFPEDNRKKILTGVMVVVLTIIVFLSVGCGYTVSGIGKDIQSVGGKLTDWQESKHEEKDDANKTSK